MNGIVGGDVTAPKKRFTREMVQLELSFDALEEIRRSRKPPTRSDKICALKKRGCLRCGREYKSRYPGVCPKCKRHVDWIEDEGEDDYSTGL
jgi:predicted Zn-ribbon and HTH transcriptional regulator